MPREMRFCRRCGRQTLHHVSGDGPRLPWKFILLRPAIWLLTRIVDGAPVCHECLGRELRERE
jgi:hypothetical protein